MIGSSGTSHSERARWNQRQHHKTKKRALENLSGESNARRDEGLAELEIEKKKKKQKEKEKEKKKRQKQTRKERKEG